MSKKFQQHQSLRVDDLSVSQEAILDAYAELMDDNEFVWLNDLSDKLKANAREYWQRGTEWRQDRLLADISSLTPSYIVEEGEDPDRGTFYMPMLWDPNAWQRREK